MAERCDVVLLDIAPLLLVCVWRVAGRRVRSTGVPSMRRAARRGSTAERTESSVKPDEKDREAQRQRQADDHASQKAALEFFHFPKAPGRLAAPRAGWA